MSADVAGRVRWVDIAKGIAIILVALYHSGLFLTGAGIVDDVWLRVNEVFTVFRMPLFFFASGLFALSVIRRTWSGLWRTRLALLVWTFLVWSLIRFAFFHVVDSPLPLDETKIVRLAIAPLWPQTGLWFLHALVVFFIMAKILDRLRIPVWLQILPAAVVSVPFFAGLSVGNISYDGMLQYFVFFLVACHFRAVVIGAVDRRGPAAAAGAMVAFASGYALITYTNITAIPGPMFVLAFIALAAGLLLARTISRVEKLARPMQWIGRETLPIYVAHVLFVAAMTQLLAAVSDTAVIRFLAPVLPVLVMGIAVAASLGLWFVLRNLPVFRYLYEAPRGVRELMSSRDRTPIGAADRRTTVGGNGWIGSRMRSRQKRHSAVGPSAERVP